MNTKKFAIGVDIGGSHISSAVIDLNKKIIIQGSFAKEDVDNKATAADIMYNWTKALKFSLTSVDVKNLVGIGFAMPGPFEYENGIARFTSEVDKYESLYGINIANYIRASLHLPENVRIRFINDASAFGIGECWAGKSNSASKSVAVTLGTGFGSAFIDNGFPVVDRNDVPGMGCLWHLPFQNGIGDDFFSTRWFIKEYEILTGQNINSVIEIVDKIPDDSSVKRIFADYGTNMANFISEWLLKFGADKLIIGGNISKAYHLFGPYLESTLKSNGVSVKINISILMETASLLGSTRILDNSYWKQVQPVLAYM